mgnify:CR=1 FL=1
MPADTSRLSAALYPPVRPSSASPAEALRAVPENYRAVVMLRDMEGLSTGETASLLEISEDNVKQRLHRGRAMLRKLLLAADLDYLGTLRW